MYKNIDELNNALKKVKMDEEGLRRDVIDNLIYTAVFSEERQLKEKAMSSIRDIAKALKIIPASIHNLYMAIGRGEVGGFTVPAINIRGMTYDIARRVFKIALDKNIGAFIFEIARSEMVYTHQRPSEYATAILAAAIKEGYRGPLFIQGDHFQFDQKRYAEEPEAELKAIKDLTKEAIDSGFYNIDIDASTLVDYSRSTLIEQQRENYENTARLTAFIREIEPNGITISVGGEIGHIGGKNSTVEEFDAFMQGYLKTLSRMGKDLPGISKISVQTGTAHGGIPLPDGRLANVRLDFEVLKNISRVARERYGLSGAVQHGASTLPDELFDRFPKVGTSEIHLATGFQNIIYDHLPKDLRDKMYEYLKEEFKDSWKGVTEKQFIYKMRKRAFGPFKQRLWTLPQEIKKKILDALEKRFEFLFERLNVFNTRPYVEEYINI